MIRYRSLIQDNARWEEFAFRPSDIVISTPPKCGTTWTQMLCALLVFDGPDFPSPLSALSRWLDQTLYPLREVVATYEAQTHRRFIKTHTPLDGLPWRDDVTYVVVGRDPRDVLVSMEHHWANMDMERVLAMRDAAVGNADLDTLPPRPALSDDPRERFQTYVLTTEYTGAVNLTQVLHHVDTAWQRRRTPNVVMCHYADYSTDLPGELVRLARALGMKIEREHAEALAREASLARMQERAVDVVPNTGIWRDTRAFLRAGAFGEWSERVTASDLEEYASVVARTVTPELAAWLHQGRLASRVDPARA